MDVPTHHSPFFSHQPNAFAYSSANDLRDFVGIIQLPLINFQEIQSIKKKYWNDHENFESNKK